MLAIHLCQTAAVKFSLYVKRDKFQEGKKLFILLSHKNAYTIAIVDDECLVKMEEKSYICEGNHKQKTYSLTMK